MSKSESELLVLRDHDVGVGGIGVFDLPLSRLVSIFFEPRVAYFEQWVDRDLTGLGRQLPSAWGEPNPWGAQGALFQGQLLDDLRGPHRRRFLRFALSVPVVFHVSDNVGIALGPDLWFDLMLRGAPARRRQYPGADAS